MSMKGTFPTKLTRQECRHCMSLTLPGLDKTFEVWFPKNRLPVCNRCKKNYKTRELCRTRDSHKDLPWTKTSICITLDHSCIDSSNKYVDGPFVAQTVPNQPFCYKNDMDTTLPICATCKSKNYTRSYCRSKMKHRHLPWNTVYVVLSADRGVQSKDSLKKKKVVPQREGGDDINEIDESKTFLLSVSSKSCTINWLAYDENSTDTKRMPSAPFAQCHAQQSDFLPSRQFFNMQQESNMVQNISHQNSANYYQTEHWQQPNSYNEMRYSNGQQFHFCQETQFPYFPQVADETERTHQMQLQGLRRPHPVQQPSHSEPYQNERINYHVQPSHQNMRGYAPMREYESNQFENVEGWTNPNHKSLSAPSLL
mmetsp:Transcript_21277/g.31276  ORF Transcript_21277/g.31276 Transcript_21277/m.31276 type:complete len:368 (+) Transcript_21277:114-1217(+)